MVKSDPFSNAVVLCDLTISLKMCLYPHTGGKKGFHNPTADVGRSDDMRRLLRPSGGFKLHAYIGIHANGGRTMQYHIQPDKVWQEQQ